MQRYYDLATRVEEISLRSRDQDYWQFRLNELDEFSPNAEDYEHLKEVSTHLRAFAEHQQVFAQAQSLLDQSVVGGQFKPTVTRFATSAEQAAS